MIVFTLLYPAMSTLVESIPNPMVPGAYLALNMIFPVIAGYFYGPVSGALAGSIGTALAALLYINQFDGLAILPHACMGFAAGWVGKYRSEIFGALTIIIGHTLNLLFYWRLGLMTIPAGDVGIILLGLASETMVDVIAIVLVIILLGRWLYTKDRW